MIRIPLSLAVRLTLLFGGATAVFLPVFGWIVFHSIESRLIAEDRDELVVVADAVQTLVNDYAVSSSVRSLEQRFKDILVGHHDASLLLMGPGEEVIYASSGPNLRDRALAVEIDGPTIMEWRDGQQHYRVLRRTLAQSKETDGYQIAVAVPIDHHLRFLSEFRLSLSVMIVGSIALLSLMGWVAVKQGHAPLHEMVGRIRRIRVDRLSTRLDERTLPSELTELAASFNEMLERVDGAFRRLHEFNADIAHELRTPIANLMTQTQVCLSRSRTAQQYRDTLYSNMEEYERMREMVADMLYLAKADSDPHPPNLELVDLGKEIDNLLEFYEGWAEEKDVELTRRGSAMIMVDRLMIQRAVSNLLSNAINHAIEHSIVSVLVRQSSHSETNIIVENVGSTINPSDLPRLFDRFYRVDDSRQNRDQGSGLGLAIVKSTVAAHSGSVGVDSLDGRTRFKISLPRIESSSYKT